MVGDAQGQDSQQADQWVRQIGVDLKAGKVEQVIARLKRLRPQSPQLRESLDSLIRYYSANATRMRYDDPGLAQWNVGFPHLP